MCYFIVSCIPVFSCINNNNNVIMNYQVECFTQPRDLPCCLKLQGQLMYQRDVVACGKKSANHGGT